MRRARLFIQMIPILSLALAANPAHGQGWLDRMKQKAKDKVEQRGDAATDSATDAVLDRTEGAVRCVIGNLACIRTAKAAGHAVAVVTAQGGAVSTADSAKAIAAASATGSVATVANSAPASSPAAGAGMAPERASGPFRCSRRRCRRHCSCCGFKSGATAIDSGGSGSGGRKGGCWGVSKRRSSGALGHGPGGRGRGPRGQQPE